ncbi:MAG: ACT domain-containing protein [Clostridia bacterium]|nr:ACT domain-containing protein [Clostridia bacterium]
MNEQQYYIVDEAVLPDIFVKVVEAKRLLSLGIEKTADRAAKAVGISRSAYYKYKNRVFPFYEKFSDKILTVSALLEDKAGILSSCLAVFAANGANILTLNQSIPTDGCAPVSISFRTAHMAVTVDELIEKLRSCDGVYAVTVLASE